MLTLYSKSRCPFCDHAKSYLRNNQIPFAEVDIEQDTNAGEFLRAEGHRTVPQIYLNGRLLVPGGWQGLSNISPQDLRDEIELRQSMDDIIL